MHDSPGRPPSSSLAVSASTTFVIATLVALPVAGFLLLLVEPKLDVAWRHQPSHFWLVLGAGALSASVAYATGVAARRRRDARVFLVSLAFLSAAAFLGLHALATPGVLLEKANSGFVIATPFGLLLASVFAGLSAIDLSREGAATVMRRAVPLRTALLLLVAAWGIVSLARLPPLDTQSVPERGSGPLVVLAIGGLALYGFALARYLRLLWRRPTPLLLGIVIAWALLAEAMTAVAFSRNWHATWWEWHVLMLTAFTIIAGSAQREWHEERFSALYLDDTVSGTRDVSVLFADLQGFTTFSERHAPHEISAMLNEYFDVAIPPIVERHGGAIDRIIGDALMVVFNRNGDQPDHAIRAVRAAMAIQSTTSEIAARHDGWPRFRVGINSGDAAVGIVGTTGGRTYTVIGDTVNLASRLEGQAAPGGVALGSETVRRLHGVRTELIGLVHVKGKREPVEVHRLLDLDTDTGAWG